jgi:putative peptide zinc metalloprotease protein
VKRQLIILLALLALLLGLPGVAQAGGDDDGGQSGDNAAIAINTKDGSSLFKFAFSLKKVLGDVVDNENAAVAYSSCESCKTTAIAIQIVFVVGSPSTVTPTNVALAVNENCTACQSFATAFQFVVGVSDASVGFTKQGKTELKAILAEFKGLKREDYTLEEFHARTQALAERLRTLLRTQLVSHADDDDEDDESSDVEEEERPAPPPAPTTTEDGTTSTESGSTSASTPTTTEPAPTVTDTQTETETATETATETETETELGATTTAP